MPRVRPLSQRGLSNLREDIVEALDWVNNSDIDIWWDHFPDTPKPFSHNWLEGAPRPMLPRINRLVLDYAQRTLDNPPRNMRDLISRWYWHDWYHDDTLEGWCEGYVVEESPFTKWRKEWVEHEWVFAIITLLLRGVRERYMGFGTVIREVQKNKNDHLDYSTWKVENANWL